MDEFDVVVIGAGPGGYVSAIRASQLGLKTAIIEKKWLGGVCLNVGCIPSKALLKNAEVAHLLRERSKDFGFTFENLALDYTVALKRSRQVSDRLTKGVGFLMKKNNIQVFMGAAKLVDAHEISVEKADGTKDSLKAKNIIIATGASASGIPGIQVDGTKVVTFNEAILQDFVPSSAVIIGAGALGLEFATIWSGYGSKVTLVEMLPRIAPLEDEEISQELTRAFNKRGIQSLAGHKVVSVKAVEAGVEVVVSGADGEKTLQADQALVAIGFKPNTAGLGLEDAGVKLSPRGHVEVNDRMATNIPGIWAIGDVTGKMLLAHVASTQGILVAEAISGKEITPIDYTMVPRATYSQPQIASFGWTEAQAREKGFEIRVGKFPLQANGKALGLGENAGFCKLVIDAKYGEILGAHLIGVEVSELLPELTLAQRMELTAEEIAANIHAHPTLSEVIMESAHAALGRSIQI
jgi:dihydrolipoamide dehydrogenase